MQNHHDQHHSDQADAERPAVASAEPTHNEGNCTEERYDRCDPPEHVGDPPIGPSPHHLAAVRQKHHDEQ